MLKRIGIAVATALISSLASAQTAQTYWSARTEAGGRIILTLAACPNERRLFAMWTEAPGGRLLHGCWHLFHDRVQVVYEDGSRYAYDPAGFVKHDGAGAPAGRPL